MMLRIGRAVAALALVAAVAAPALAAPKKIKPDDSARGEVKDRKLMKDAPKEGYITDRKVYEDLVKKWDVKDAPKADFRKQMVLVATTTGSKFVAEGNVRLDDGDLQFKVGSTRDLRPGFRYILLVVPKAGVKKVNGKDVK